MLNIGCAEEPVAPPPAKRVNVVTKKASAPTAVAGAKVEKVKEVKEKTKYAYNPAGKVDPFLSYLAYGEEASVVGVDADPRTDLEELEMGELNLVAVMDHGGKKMAMVEDPDGKGHKLTIGTSVGRQRAKVVSIGEGIVIMEEKYRDPLGELMTRTIELSINVSEGVK